MLENVADYYAKKINHHGCTPAGVDWNSKASQETRFAQLTRIIDDTSTYSINDLGAGYGALFNYLNKKKHRFEYVGYDISQDMLDHAHQLLKNEKNAQFIHSDKCTIDADYAVASGIFNVKLAHLKIDWENFILQTLHNLFDFCKRGFSFNCLTSYSDVEYMQDYLYYADPCWLFDYCKRSFSRNIALLDDYELYEFTILVRK